ncbi:hypothetical protein [Pseudonocardia asaccharolytica]|uniref:Uncharacterized protein n=1 Tax=Pseudonocardia asaccharolytica DSM 44247 = NBRC 16224 TaxID=1123024 RepID=A0A511D5R8_9PSEU|nr:hypothetical protein [Pseudonocardia asaccharolytica]GEL20125.1 hypothetical protein PA7_39620 [Pseudonocardia asaccharolytica DSM 44247 = NBRC 16224]
MRLVFAPGEHEEYSLVRDRLLTAVLARSRRRGEQVDPALVAAALDYKHGVDRRLGHWTRAHVADALAVWFPRTVAVADSDWAEIPAALHALIGTLAERDHLDSRSASPEELHAQVDDSAPALFDALADERNYDLGKFWNMQMMRHGVDKSDVLAVQRFLDQAKRGELGIDRGVLDAIVEEQARRAEADRETAADLGPVLLPSAAQLVIAAERSIALERLRAFTYWVRGGRPLTREGRLWLSDALALADALGVDRFYRDAARTSDDLPEVSLLLDWARQARLVRTIKRRLVPVKSAGKLLHRPIELWRRAFEALGRLGDHFGGSDVYGSPSLFSMALGTAFPMLWLGLYSAAGDPVPVELFHRQVREAVNEQFGCVVDDLAGDVEQRLWRRDVSALLDALELLGAVELEESTDHAHLAELAGRDDPDPTVVSLTPIGLWACHQILTEQGVHAPLVGELAHEDIEYVCVKLAATRTEVAHAELAAWVTARDPGTAARELSRLLRRTNEPAHRKLAVYALARTGDTGRSTRESRNSHGRVGVFSRASRGSATSRGTILPAP